MLKKYKVDMKPTQVLVLGFLLVIIVGALCLNMPFASQDGHSVGFVNALFTSTSAVCVTGLAVVNTLHHWTIFGQLVILLLIQVGGLGFMTITTTLFILLGKKIRLKDRLIIQEAMNQYTLAGMVRLIKNVFIGTMIIEAIGAVLLSIRFVPEYHAYGIYMGIFHSISAFCNAGFDIIGYESAVPYVGDILVNVTLMSLIVLGGLGFSVWLDVIKVTKEARKNKYGIAKWFRRLTLHTKLVLVLTLSLILVGFAFFFILEGGNPGTLGGMGLKEKILGSLFQSVTSRTAGYNTIPQATMTDSSKFMTIILMFIGGSPAGTAGGIKTVTFGVLFFSVVSVVRSKEHIEVYHKRIPIDIVQKALAILSISLVVVFFVTMLLSITEGAPFMDVFFETMSAFATVGLTLGMTPSLTTIGKLILSLTMFIGRLGPVTMVVAFTLKSKSNKTTIVLPEEKVMVG